MGPHIINMMIDGICLKIINICKYTKQSIEKMAEIRKTKFNTDTLEMFINSK